MEQMEVWLKEFLLNYEKKYNSKDNQTVFLKHEKKYNIWNKKLDKIVSNQRLESYKKREKEMVFLLLKKMMGSPLKEEVEAYGKLLFSDDVTEEQTKQVADILTEEEIKNQHIWNKLRIMLGIKQGVLKESAWIEGSIVDCGKNMKKNLHHAVMYKYLIYIRKAFKQ